MTIQETILCTVCKKEKDVWYEFKEDVPNICCECKELHKSTQKRLRKRRATKQNI